MSETKLLDISLFCEKAIAFEVLLLYICGTLPTQQAEKILHLLSQHREFIAAMPDDNESKAGWLLALPHLSPFEEALSGVPVRPTLH